MPSSQSRIIEQAKFTYSSLCKTFEKQIKTTEDQGIKQVEPVKTLKPEENEKLELSEVKWRRNNEIKNEVDKCSNVVNVQIIFENMNSGPWKIFKSQTIVKRC